MTEFAALRPKSQRYLTDDNRVIYTQNIVKITKRYVIKRKPKFEGYKNCLEANQLEKEIKNLLKNCTDNTV